MSDLAVATINIPIKVGAEAWAECVVKAMNNGDVIVLNEILSQRQRDVVLDVIERNGYAQYGIRQNPNPVLWDASKFKLVAGRVVEIHGKGPWAKRFPGYNAERYFTVVVLRPVSMGDDDSRDFVVIGLHWVSGGSKLPSAWRGAMRLRSQVLLRRVLWQCRRKGMVAVVMGDTNIAAPFKIRVPGFRWVRGKGIDKVGLLLPRKVRRGISRFRLFFAPTDHKYGVAAVLRWMRAREVKA